MSLLGRSKIVPAIVPTAGSPTTLTCTEVDATGFDRACFLFVTGSANVGATMTLKVTSASATGMGGAGDVSGAALTELAAAGANKVYGIDMIVDPAKPFLKLSGANGTAAMANAAVAVLYEGSGQYPKTAATQAVIAS